MSKSLQTRTARSRRQRGSALLELTITLLGFLMMTLGSMDAAWAIYAYNFCSYAAQDAARWASVHGSQSGAPAAQTDVANYVQAEAVGLTTSNLSVTATWSPNNAPGSTVTVVVGYTVNPLSGLGLKQNLHVSSTAEMYIDH